MRKQLGEPAYQPSKSSSTDQATSTDSTAAQQATNSFLALLNQKTAASGTSPSAANAADAQTSIGKNLAGAGAQMLGGLINAFA